MSSLLQLQDEKATPFDPATFSRPKTGGALDRADTTKVEAAMKAFCGMYDDANPDAVPDVLSEDFYEVHTDVTDQGHAHSYAARRLTVCGELHSYETSMMLTA